MARLDELRQVHEDHGHHQGSTNDHGGLTSAAAQQLLLPEHFTAAVESSQGKMPRKD